MKNELQTFFPAFKHIWFLRSGSSGEACGHHPRFRSALSIRCAPLHHRCNSDHVGQHVWHCHWRGGETLLQGCGYWWTVRATQAQISYPGAWSDHSRWLQNFYQRAEQRGGLPAIYPAQCHIRSSPGIPGLCGRGLQLSNHGPLCQQFHHTLSSVHVSLWPRQRVAGELQGQTWTL